MRSTQTAFVHADAASVQKMVAIDGGARQVATVGGCELTATAEGGRVTLTDENGNDVTVTQADVAQRNGVIHVIDTVILPTS